MIAGANSRATADPLNGQTVGGIYISGAHGSTTAGPVWGDAMKAHRALLPDTPSTDPTRSTIEGQTVDGPVAVRAEHRRGRSGAAQGRASPR